jgi:hypothetical protein
MEKSASVAAKRMIARLPVWEPRAILQNQSGLSALSVTATGTAT